MNVKEAVTTAKEFAATLFADEGLSNMGLEEVEYDETNSMWSITLGFNRAWNKSDYPKSALNSIMEIQGGSPTRLYKVVRIRESGEKREDGAVISVKNRE